MTRHFARRAVSQLGLLIAGLAVSAVFAATAAAFTPSGPNPADIPQAMSQCPQYRLCMWQDSGYSGIVFTAGGEDTTWQYVGDGFNDLASSIWNTRTNASWVNRYWPAGHDDACIGGGGGWYYNNLYYNLWPQDSSGANDTISSYWVSEKTFNNCSGEPQLLNK
jgi:hypothetical protein